MDIEILLSDLNDITECGICTETLCDPRLLPCAHNFCLVCLQQLLRAVCNSERKLVCPMCRSEFSVPLDGMEALPKNFMINQLIDAMKNSKKNSVTQTTQNYCATGSGSKPSVVQSGPSVPLNHCRKHTLSELCLYCQDCKVVMCSRCFDEDHKRHRTSNLKEIGDKLRKQIHVDIEELSVCLNEVHRRKDELEKSKEEFLVEIDKSEEAVVEQFTRVMELVERHRQSLIRELVTLKRNRLKEIENDREDLDRHLVVLESCERYMQDMRMKMSVDDICRSFDELNARVQELQVLHKTWMDRPHSQNPTLSFEATDLDGGLAIKNGNIIGQVKVRHPGYLRLDSRLDLENLSVRGVVGHHRKFYVISRDSDFIEVFREQKGIYLHLRRIKISGLKSAQDIALCHRSGSVYVTDQGNACVWKVTLDDHRVKRWLNNIDDPYTVSVTEEGEVVLLKNGPPSALTVYSPEAGLFSSIPLLVPKERALHAVRKSSRGNYVISQGHCVYEMTPEGVIQRKSALDPSALFLHLAVSEDGRILAADYTNGKVVLLDTDLSLAEVLLSKVKNDLQWPCRLSYCKQKLLVVHKGIDIYTVLKM